jgi:intracellular septation protein
MAKETQPTAKEPKQGPGPATTRSTTLEDFGPLLVFFAAYRLRGIYWATGAFMIAATAALAYAYYRDRKVRPMTLVTLAVVLVFGGMTIWFGDPRFIYVKPTIITSLTGAVLLGGLAFRRPLLKPVLSSALEMRDEGWRTLSLRFALFSFALAGINELVWRRFTPEQESVWVWFKFLGIPGLTLVFLLTQTPLIKRFQIERPSPS